MHSDDPDQLRRRFLDAGMAVLARDGYAGFKQSAVCTQAGVTTGAFYHSFRNWREFSAALIKHWRLVATDRLVEHARSVDDPHARIESLIDIALSLPHDTERAMRTWAAADPEVREAVADVERARTDAITEMGTELFGPELARRLSAASMLMLGGFESSTSPSKDDFEWAMRALATAAYQMIDARGRAAQTSE